MSKTNSQDIPVLRIEALNESLKVIALTLNRSVKSGVFESIDDAYLLRLSLNHLENAVKTVEMYQTKYAQQPSQKAADVNNASA